MVVWTVLTQLGKASKEKKSSDKSDQEIYSGGFHTIGGFISGFLMVFLWDRLHLPYMDYKIKKSLITHEDIPNSKGITVDKSVALFITTILMLSDLLGVKGGMPSGAGFLMGYTLATDFRKGKYLGEV